MTCIALHNTELTADFVVGFNAAHASVRPGLIHLDPHSPGVWYLNTDPSLSSKYPALALYEAGLLLLNVIQFDPLRVFESLQPDAVLVVEDMVIERQENLDATVHSFPDVQIEAVAVEGVVHRVQVTAGAGLVRVLQALMCLAMADYCTGLAKSKTRFLQDHHFNRHVELLNQSNAPYLLRYMLVRDSIKRENTFEESRTLLQTPDMFLNFKNTQEARHHAIKEHLGGGDYLVDIGCGKAFLLIRLSHRYGHMRGYEATRATLIVAKRNVTFYQVPNAKLFDAFTHEDAKQISEGAHVVMTEVLEHMPKPDSESMLLALRECKASKMVFTVPNRGFNKHYGLPEGAKRHWDHHWEPTLDEFKDLLNTTLGDRWKLNYFGIGDRVAGQASTLLATATHIVHVPSRRLSRSPYRSPYRSDIDADEQILP